LKNIDFIIKKIAEKNGWDERLVDKVVKHHWRVDIKKEILSNNHSAIYLRYIGTMVFSKMKTRTAIERTIASIRRAEISTKWTETKRVEIIESYKVKLRKLLVQRNLLAIQYKERGNAIENNRIRKAAATGFEESGKDN
jgi:hypothetical protein